MIPNPPSGLFAEPISPTQIYVEWTPSPDPVDGYNVYRSRDPDEVYELVAQGEGNAFYDAELIPNKTYYYLVDAYSGEFVSPQIGPAAATTFAVPAPTILRNQLECRFVCWPDFGAESYSISRSTNVCGPFDYLVRTARTSYKDCVARAGVTYYYRIIGNFGGQLRELVVLKSAPGSSRKCTCPL